MHKYFACHWEHSFLRDRDVEPSHLLPHYEILKYTSLFICFCFTAFPAFLIPSLHIAPSPRENVQRWQKVLSLILFPQSWMEKVPPCRKSGEASHHLLLPPLSLILPARPGGRKCVHIPLYTHGRHTHTSKKQEERAGKSSIPREVMNGEAPHHQHGR